MGASVGYSRVAAAVAVNTTMAAATGCIGTLLISMVHQKLSLGVVVWDLIIAGNGALAGLVAITGGCAFVETWAALLTGLIAGPVYYGASKINLHLLKVGGSFRSAAGRALGGGQAAAGVKLKHSAADSAPPLPCLRRPAACPPQIDDPLDAIAVHAGCGVWGMVAGAAFATPGMVADYYGNYPSTDSSAGPSGRAYGFIMGDNGDLLGAHLVYIIVIAAWVLGIMTPYFAILKRLGLFRVSPGPRCALPLSCAAAVMLENSSMWRPERPLGGRAHRRLSMCPTPAAPLLLLQRWRAWGWTSATTAARPTPTTRGPWARWRGST